MSSPTRFELEMRVPPYPSKVDLYQEVIDVLMREFPENFVRLYMAYRSEAERRQP